MTLAAREVSLSLGGASLLQAIDMELQPGRVTAVLGPNGAGKTSLLRVLCGELDADAGAVSLAGTPIRQWPAAERAKTLAVLPQHSALNFPFTASEVVMLGRTPHDAGLARDLEIVKLALQAVDGGHLARREFTRLSGGEKQRVHLARVLAQIWEESGAGPRFMLLDEPTSSLDLAHQRMTRDIVRRLGEEGVGVLLVLHDLNLAARCADHLVLLRCGTIAASGSPDEVLTADVIRDVFEVEATIVAHPDGGTPLVIT